MDTLREFHRTDKPGFIAADLSALELPDFKAARQSTDVYLAELARKHGLKFATFDERIQHPSVELIPT